VIAPKGAVRSGIFDPTVEAIVLDDDVATPWEVPLATAAAISAADETGDTGLGDGMGPPADSEQPTPRMQGEASEVSGLGGTSSCPAEALTLSEVERWPLPVSLLSLVRTEPKARRQDEPRQGLPELLPSFVLDDAEEQRHWNQVQVSGQVGWWCFLTFLLLPDMCGMFLMRFFHPGAPCM
jgi:hypothetical protein